MIPLTEWVWLSLRVNVVYPQEAPEDGYAKDKLLLPRDKSPDVAALPYPKMRAVPLAPFEDVVSLKEWVWEPLLPMEASLSPCQCVIP